MSQAAIVGEVKSRLYDFYDSLPNSNQLQFYALIQQCMEDFWQRFSQQTGNNEWGYTWILITMDDARAIGIIKRDLIPRLESAKVYKGQYPALVVYFDSLCKYVEDNFGDGVQRVAQDVTHASEALTSQDMTKFNERISTMESQIKGFYLDKTAYYKDNAALLRLLKRIEDLESTVATLQQATKRSWWGGKSEFVMVRLMF